MATLMQIHEMINGAPELRQRFASARIKAAWDIRNEDAGTTGHAARLTWANARLADYDLDLDTEYLLFLSNATIQTNGNQSTDNDIQFVVNSFVNEWAGVS